MDVERRTTVHDAYAVPARDMQPIQKGVHFDDLMSSDGIRLLDVTVGRANPPDAILQLEQIKMLNEVCGPRGKAGCTFLNGAAATPVLNVR